MASRQPEGPPPPPTVQRVRLRYTKRGRLRFTSHRDIARVVERAVRRARLPIAHSAGFSPHPRISWVGAAPTGVASEAEYVEIGLTELRDVEEVRRALDEVLPAGLDLIEAVTAVHSGFADRMEASVFSLVLPGADAGQVQAAMLAFEGQAEVLVERRTKSGMKPVDVRSAVVSLVRSPAADDACVILRLVVRHTTPVVRPDDVLTGLRALAPLELDSPLVATRLAQGPLRQSDTDGAEPGVDDPLAPDRAAEGRETG
ncbi:MAG TPA: TIGR03936 family radical SAM-associated protein [Mycobacteriales bacterium]|nr:TIGR03936 family radical SAM-associated protein [Mycobacteriales bacterium]